ncbi:MAG: ornithine carbamoyltransferase, partial [Fusobacteriaceae bacterium]|nr:ornithine carbamoyltransferase [Fusobacteriaceae bacterium]
MKGRSFLTLLDYTKEEILYLIDLAKKLKQDKKNGKEKKYLKNKNIVLLFEKDSTRTRCAFEVGAYDQGANVTYIGSSGSQMGKKESIKDTARVLGRMYDGIEYRGYEQEIVETLAKYSGVPVWNGLTTEFHPTQVLADLLTIKEHFGKLEGLNFTYFGDGRNNMANSLMIGCAKVGI